MSSFTFASSSLDHHRIFLCHQITVAQKNLDMGTHLSYSQAVATVDCKAFVSCICMCLDLEINGLASLQSFQ